MDDSKSERFYYIIKTYKHILYKSLCLPLKILTIGKKQLLQNIWKYQFEDSTNFYHHHYWHQREGAVLQVVWWVTAGKYASRASSIFKQVQVFEKNRNHTQITITTKRQDHIISINSLNPYEDPIRKDYLMMMKPRCREVKELARASDLPVRMAITQKTRNNTCWRECGEKRALVHC